ncbi:hypothetical protein [Geomonas edaphica]|uniref:hypothetical protein n=1 Tax=Geomonas edaphica TaxID=2570226 RepID=UPI0010A75C9C|nr:hypothetical protein [Geomonas edaphica]
MFLAIMKYCAVLLLLCSALPSSAEALPYTRYNLTGHDDSVLFNGYAIFNNNPTIYTSIYQSPSPFDFPAEVSETFSIPKFYLTSSTGDIYVGSGYLQLMDLHGQANDCWNLGPFYQYSPTGGYGSVSQELDHSPNGLPITLPDSFYFFGGLATDYSIGFDGGLHFSNPEAIPAVPEPGTFRLLAAGLCCLILVSKCRQSWASF